MKRIILPVMLLIAAAAPVRAAKTDEKVAYVDVQRVVTESDAGKVEVAKIQELSDRLIQGVNAAITDAQKAKGTKDEQAKTARARVLGSQMDASVDAAKAESATKLKAEIRDVAEKLAKERKVDRVIDASFLYTANDWTKDVITRLDAETADAAARAKAAAEKEKARGDRLEAENKELKDKLAASTPPKK